MSDTKPAVTLAVCGHVDSGKSTLVGHLLNLLGDVSDEEIKKDKAEAAAMGKSSFGYAWALDHGKDERERGVTINSHSVDFDTTKVSESLLVCTLCLHTPHPPCDNTLLPSRHLVKSLHTPYIV